MSYTPRDIGELYTIDDIGRIEIYRCPFCYHSAPAHLPLSKISGQITWEASFTCTKCGKIMVRYRLFDQDTMLLTFGLPGSKFLAREKEVAPLMDDISIEASKAVTHGVLGGYTKDTIQEEFTRRGIMKSKKNDQVFEEVLKKVLDDYEMKFCPYCDRYVKKSDSFCSYCGRALV